MENMCEEALHVGARIEAGGWMGDIVAYFYLTGQRMAWLSGRWSIVIRLLIRIVTVLS